MRRSAIGRRAENLGRRAKAATLALVALCAAGAATPARAGDGRIDASFGDGGRVVTDFGGFDAVVGVAVQPDGKIVAAGVTIADDYRTVPALARYNSDGTFDDGFGSGGRVVAPNEFFQTSVQDMALAPDGGIVLVGTTTTTSMGTNCLVLKFDAAGRPDAVFGQHGQSAPPFASSGIATDVLVQPDGRILVGGFMDGAAGLMRLGANGEVDLTFGDRGRAMIPDTDNALALALQADGKVLVGAVGDGEVVVARLTAAGGPDRKFGKGGTLRYQFSGCPGGATRDAYPSAFAVQVDGKIVVTGGIDVCGTPSQDAFVLRLSRKGKVDASFGIGGAVTHDVRGWQDSPLFVSAERDGRFLVAGGAFIVFQGPSFGLFRLLADGQVDWEFGEEGVAGSAFDSLYDQVYSVAREPTGRILMAGSLNGDFVVERYENAAAPPEITAVRVDAGGELVVEGRFFDRGSEILVDGVRYATAFDEKRAGRALTSARAARATRPGRTVQVVVRASDGVASAPFSFRRP